VRHEGQFAKLATSFSQLNGRVSQEVGDEVIRVDKIQSLDEIFAILSSQKAAPTHWNRRIKFLCEAN